MADNLVISVSRHQAMSELWDVNDKNNDLEDNKNMATYHQSLGWLGRCCSVFSVQVLATVKVPQTAPLTSVNTPGTGPSAVPTRQQQGKTLSFHPNLVDAVSFYIMSHILIMRLIFFPTIIEQTNKQTNKRYTCSIFLMHTGVFSVHETWSNNLQTITRWQIRDSGHNLDRGGGFQTQQWTQLWLLQPEKIWGVGGRRPYVLRALYFQALLVIMGNKYIDVQYPLI